MTVFQPNTGSGADRGTIGFEPGTGRQFLIFPKSLRALSGCKIVGIKYDLWKTTHVSARERAKPPKPPAKQAAPKKPKARREKKTPANVLPFKQREDHEEEENPEILELKRKVRQAMAILEDGKAVAAFNLLKRIVES